MALFGTIIASIVLAYSPTKTTDTCGAAEMRTHYFSGSVGIAKRVIDRHRCGVIELRVVDHYDLDAASRTREVFRDLDHDGEFERYWTRVEPLRGHNADLAWGRVSPTATVIARKR